jgi:hypothetical protein
MPLLHQAKKNNTFPLVPNICVCNGLGLASFAVIKTEGYFKAAKTYHHYWQWHSRHYCGQTYQEIK